MPVGANMADGDPVGTSESLVMLRVGGREYPVESSPGCATCQHPLRRDIERAWIRGYRATAILEAVPVPGGLSSSSLTNHFANHLHLDQVMRQALMDRIADADAEVAHLTDHVMFAKVGVALAFGDMMDGSATPTLAEATQMASLLERVEQRRSEDSYDDDATFEGFRRWSEIIMEEVSPEQAQAIASRLQSDPTIASLVRRATGRPPPRALEADVVEED